MILCISDETSGMGFNQPRMKQRCFMSATSKMGHAKNSLRNDTVKTGQSILLHVNCSNHSLQYRLSDSWQ